MRKEQKKLNENATRLLTLCFGDLLRVYSCSENDNVCKKLAKMALDMFPRKYAIADDMFFSRFEILFDMK